VVAARWVWRGEADEAAQALAGPLRDAGLRPPDLLARLLWNRGVRDGDEAIAFLRPTLAHGLRSPLLLKDMDAAAARLADALARGERVAVYGDYDVDGVTGAAQLVLFLRELGADPLVHVSNRFREGYGLHGGAIRALAEAGARVLVTADCGTANVEELALAASLGLDVIVCDHHHAPVTRPPAMAVLNPLRADCAFPFKGLSGAGVVFYLLMGLRMELRARGHGPLPDLRPYLDLVALGTVADVVPLREENRVLVAHGLRMLDRTTRPGLQALKEAAVVERASVRAIGFRLAPRLNAGGRLAEARRAVDVLVTTDPDEARALAAELECCNAERRAIEEAMVADAVRLVDERPGRSIVVARDGWHQGVVGIVAARLAERYHRPALVIALDGAVGRGSGRSVRGVDLHGAVSECRALLETFGGHRQAVGFSLRRERVDELAASFEEAVRRRVRPADTEPLLALDAEVMLSAVTPALAEALVALEPHGPGNPEPVFLARDVRVVAARSVGDPSRPHLRLRLSQDGRTVPAIAFGRGNLAIGVGDRLDVAFTPRLSRWQGVDRLEIEVIDLRECAAAGEALQLAGNTQELHIP
jgi:single-stranded-DNA-specific exonuclease